jgi:hypothetical protein
VLISNQVNIWADIESDKVGFVEDDSVEGTEQLLRRWFDVLPQERDAIAARARPSFLKRYTMNRTAVAIDRIFSSGATSSRPVHGGDWVLNDADGQASTKLTP